VPLLIVAAAVVAAGAAGLNALSRRQRRRQLELNAVVPGVVSLAPPGWALAHDPEARLHRRLRDAVAAMRADPRVRTADLHELRMITEREALALDERLVAVANLPAPSREDPLKRLAAGVETLESAVAEIVSWSPATGGELTAAVADATERLAAIAEIQAELSAFPLLRPLPEPPPASPPAPPPAS
jgi:hypothetical protein